jgi:hypothetical protein
MLLTYVAASVAAALLSVRLRQYPNWSYWRCWDVAGFRSAIAAVAALHVMAGVLATVLSSHLGWHVVESGQGDWLVNGAAYGLAGVSLLRVDVSGFGVGLVAPPLHILRQLLELVEPVLDKRSEGAVDIQLSGMSHSELRRCAWKLYYRHVASNPHVRRKIQARFLDEIKEHGNTESPTDQDSEYLSAFCLAQITTHRHDRMMPNSDNPGDITGP